MLYKTHKKKDATSATCAWSERNERRIKNWPNISINDRSEVEKIDRSVSQNIGRNWDAVPCVKELLFFIAYQITADIASAAICRDSYSAQVRDKRYPLYWGTDCQTDFVLYVHRKGEDTRDNMSRLFSSATDIGPYCASEPYMDSEDTIYLFPYTELNAVAWCIMDVELQMYKLLTPPLEGWNFKPP
jgi:hypothetical protein